MWRLKHIKAGNIVSFEELDLEVEQNVATFIFGENKDNAQQRHNGSGKSALVEAIAFGITGDTFRDVKTIEEIIFDNADEAYVQLELENDFLNLSFMVERTISRKNPQIIECHLYDLKTGREVHQDRTVQDSVNSYNKYILEEIGLTKDDIYGSFILCRDRYKSFFKASDKDKKELINRFSNGSLVDRSIEQLQQDLQPIEGEYYKIVGRADSLASSIETVNTQIDDAKNKAVENQKSRAVRIEGLKEQIGLKRTQIRETKESIEESKKRLQILNDVRETLEELEGSDDSVIMAYQAIVKLFDENKLQPIRDFEYELAKNIETLNRTKDELGKLEKNIAFAEKNVGALEADLQERVKEYDDKNADVDSQNKKNKAQIDSLEADVWKLDAEIGDIKKQVADYRRQSDDLEREAGRIENILHGTIVCPKCKHEFLLDSEKSVDEWKVELPEVRGQIQYLQRSISNAGDECKKKEAKAEEKTSLIKTIEKKQDEIRRVLKEAIEGKNDAQNKLSEAKSCLAVVKSDAELTKQKISACQGKIDGLRKDMFDAAFDEVDGKLDKGEAYVRKCKSDITIYKSSIEQFEQSITELLAIKDDDLEKSLYELLEKYEGQLKEAKEELADIEQRRDELKQQEQYFLRFKSYLACTKIDAISAIINNFLEEIGSDIRIHLEGFKMTKTGKMRDKINVTILRDGIDCGSFGKFSGGEKARICLASILAMRHLINSNCEEGRGLDFLVIDEILDASDEEGLASFGSALNQLRVSSFVITQGAVAESYPHKLIVTKEYGTSTISR